MMTDANPDLFIAAKAVWAGVVVIGIAGLFIASAAIGIMARAVMPERYPADNHPQEAPY